MWREEVDGWQLCPRHQAARTLQIPPTQPPPNRTNPQQPPADRQWPWARAGTMELTMAHKHSPEVPLDLDEVLSWGAHGRSGTSTADALLPLLCLSGPCPAWQARGPHCHSCPPRQSSALSAHHFHRPGGSWARAGPVHLLMFLSCVPAPLLVLETSVR